MGDKRTIGEIAGNKKYMDTKIPQNPKYKEIKSNINTGITQKNVQTISDKQLARRKGENFSRLKPSTLVKLLQVDNNPESIYNINNEIQNLDLNEFDDKQSQFTQTSQISQKSQKTNQTNQTGTMSLNTQQCNEIVFVLYDLRDSDDYEKYRIKDSENFPGTHINRDKFPSSIYNFKNKPDALIIIYHLDEKNGIPFAQLLFEKGYNNIFLVSGGIEDFIKEHRDYCEGKDIPIMKKSQQKQVVYQRSNETKDTVDNKIMQKEKLIANKNFQIQDNMSMTSKDTVSQTGSKITQNKI